MLDLSTIIQIVSNHTALIAIIITIGSFFISLYYARKPAIHIKEDIKEGRIINCNFIIENVSKNSAKNIYIKIKLGYKGKTQTIKEQYELPHLNPEDKEDINISEEIEKYLINQQLLIKSTYKWPMNPDTWFMRYFLYNQIELIESGYYKEEELQEFHSHQIDDSFKFLAEFKISCNSDFPFKYNFPYKFDISCTKFDKEYMDFLENQGDERYQEYQEVLYNHRDNFKLSIQPSKGKWK